MDVRERFEALPEISELLGFVKWSEKHKSYISSSENGENWWSHIDACGVQLAWLVYNQALRNS